MIDYQMMEWMMRAGYVGGTCADDSRVPPWAWRAFLNLRAILSAAERQRMILTLELAKTPISFAKFFA